MPDGTTILARRWSEGVSSEPHARVADGVGPDRAIGPSARRILGRTTWIAPDGKTVFAVYHDDGVEDGKIWSIDVATGVGHESRFRPLNP